MCHYIVYIQKDWELKVLVLQTMSLYILYTNIYNISICP